MHPFSSGTGIGNLLMKRLLTAGLLALATSGAGESQVATRAPSLKLQPGIAPLPPPPVVQGSMAGASRQKPGARMLLATEVASGASFGLGLFERIPRYRGSASEQIGLKLRTQRKAAVGISLSF
jgi:hypothetical protein